MKRFIEEKATITIRDVASLAGVSVATASYALNNVGRVAPETRAKVLKIAADIGYAPSLAARSLKGGKGRVIAILTFGMGGPWYGEILDGLQDTLNNQGYPVIASTLQEDALTLCKSLVSDGLVLGVILLNPGVRNGGYLNAILNAVPSVLFGGDSALTGTVSYLLDNKGGEESLVTHLWERGYRDFAWLDGMLTDSLDARERWESFSNALHQRGFDVSTIKRISGDFRAPSAEIAVGKFLATGARPRVIVAANDEMALGAIMAIRNAGLSIPDDIAVAGFDGIDSAAWNSPALTTLCFDRRSLGQQMALRLVDAIEHQRATSKPEMVPVQLAIRSST